MLSSDPLCPSVRPFRVESPLLLFDPFPSFEVVAGMAAESEVGLAFARLLEEVTVAVVPLVDVPPGVSVREGVAPTAEVWVGVGEGGL